MSPKKPSTVRQGTMVIPGQYTSSDSKVVTTHPLKAQKIKVEIHKGQKKVLKGKYSPTPFLGSNGYGQYIPFQRTGDDRNKFESIKSTSVPQMIEHENVEENIKKRVNEELQKRLEYHVKQAMK
jgi:hypothetical protein